MSRIVITTFGSFGDVNPYIGLGLELKRRGDQPVPAMPGIFCDAVEREELAFAAILPTSIRTTPHSPLGSWIRRGGPRPSSRNC